jgi:hypothetical protein
MNTNNLFLFSKNTDASASMRGYNYQTLKTLETWVFNFLNKYEDIIYCEYEEDIFQKNNFNNTLKFRQIKLYSSNFSFKSEEITKCIAHFFMLHCKSDYQTFDKEFIFETNSEIARNYVNNDAHLLREWFDNQENLTTNQIKSISKKVKEICSEYIKNQSTTILKDSNSEFIKETLTVFKNLDRSFWENFTKLIKWNFSSINPDEEFANTKKRIETLLYQLPYEINEDNIQQIFGVLLERVFNKASQKNFEDRSLNSVELDLLILNISKEEDKWYSEKYEYYLKIDNLEHFKIGEFYEILDLVNYCRRKKYLVSHKTKWQSFLAFYIKDKEIADVFKRKVIYELIFLLNELHEIDYSNLTAISQPKGNLLGIENEIRFFYKDIEKLIEADELERSQIILSVLYPAVLSQKVNISQGELDQWTIRLYKTLSYRLIKTEDINEKCRLLEEKGTFLMKLNLLRNRNETTFIQYFEKILIYIENAHLYKASQFSDRINKYIKIFINFDPSDEKKWISVIESFSEKLSPYIEKREGKIKVAQQQVERGISYLKCENQSGLLKALEYFHKAKDNYLQEDTIEGYILALLNISQLYNSIGMTFAAKQYALAGARVSMNKQSIKQLESSFALLFYSDFKAGSWMNAIDTYEKYILLRDQSNLGTSNFEDESKITFHFSLILYSLKKLTPQFNFFVENHLMQLDYIAEEIIKPIFKIFDHEIGTLSKLHTFLNNSLIDFPLNDIGRERIISFYALGSLWEIKFQNNHYITSVAEEYISKIQIILTEIALSNVDFHLLKSTIEIELKLSNIPKSPIQEASNDIIKWKVFISHIETKNQDKLNEHEVFNMVSFQWVLNHISLLKEEEFRTMFFKFMQDRSLSSKQTSVNLYQRIHRDFYHKEQFDFSMRDKFNKETFDLQLPSENKFMKWNASLSVKYNKEKSIEFIKNRFRNIEKCIYLTLKNLKDEIAFQSIVNKERARGYKDWQIILNIFNFIIDYKIKYFEDFPGEKVMVHWYPKMVAKYQNMDEKDCFIKFPPEVFLSKEFIMQCTLLYSSILTTYDLENKLRTPNFQSIKEFLDVKFNMIVDDYDEKNPLKDIK